MLNDFIPIFKNISLKDHPNSLTVVPLSDAHYGSKDFNEVLWHKAIQRIQDDPECYCVLVGDLMDNGLKNSLTNVYDAVATPREQKAWLINELTPIKSKILAACGGNHERRTKREVDIDPLYDVMLALGREAVYRPNICFLHLRLMPGKSPTPRATFSFAITHGYGGGMYVGSSANKVQNFGMAIEGIDGIITGHTHKPLTFPVSKLVFDPVHKTVIQKQFTVVVASSFLDYGGYPVERLMVPTAKTITEIKLLYGSRGGYKELKILQ